MPKQKIEIEIDVPEGWELTGEFRKLQSGDFYMNGSQLCEWQSSGSSSASYPIVRKSFRLPDWIPAGWWVAKDASGDIYCYELEPMPDHLRREWVAEGRFLDVTLLFDAHQIDLPDVRWDEAKWQQVGKSEVKDY